MKFLLSLTVFMALAIAGIETNAAPLKRLFQDVKLPTQKVIEVLSLTAPAANGTTQILNAVAGPTSAAAASVTSFAAQPDFPRNIVVTAGNSSADLSNCTVTVSGLNTNSHSMSETFAFTSGSLGAVTGNKAFKTISSVSFPANCETGSFATQWSIGYGVKFGLKRCMANAGDDIKDLLDGAKAGTQATYAVSSTAVESNTVTFNTTPNASHNYISYYMQNNQCF